MEKNKKNIGSDLGDYLDSSLSLTPEQIALAESTEALRELSMDQMALVLSALFED